jgi:hypothetical protein
MHLGIKSKIEAIRSTSRTDDAAVLGEVSMFHDLYFLLGIYTFRRVQTASLLPTGYSYRGQWIALILEP